MMHPRQIWILDEGSQGHVVQSRGLIRELAKYMRLEVTEIRVQSILPRRFERSILKRLLQPQRGSWLFRSLFPRVKLPPHKPDLIVSSGPHSLAALEYLAKQYQCPSALIQGTIQVPENAVTCIIRPFEGSYRDDYIFIPLLFNEVTPAGIEQAGLAYQKQQGRRKNAPLKALFIGASSAKIHFEDSDWDRLIEYVNQAWRSDGIQWLVSTSYRTGSRLEEKLRQRLPADAIYDAVWYSRDARSITREFLGLADQVYVTMDSLTMMSEAVSSGLPVFLICPDNQQLNPRNSHHIYIERLAAANHLTLLWPGRGAPIGTCPPPPAMPDYREAIHHLLNKIGWNI